MAIADGDINGLKLETDEKTRVVITGAARGYPKDYSKIRGKRIFGLEEARETGGVKIYGAAVKKEGNVYRADGGRLFYVDGEGEDLREARGHAYRAMKKISIEDDGLFYRHDIARS
jgi:phosphoribosylamine--glycine ligase